MSGYLLTAMAVRDIESIRLHLHRAGDRASRTMSSKSFVPLSNASATCRGSDTRPDLTDEPARFWPVFSDLIVYDPAPRPIHIIRVLHGPRDLANML